MSEDVMSTATCRALTAPFIPISCVSSLRCEEKQLVNLISSLQTSLCQCASEQGTAPPDRQQQVLGGGSVIPSEGAWAKPEKVQMFGLHPQCHPNKSPALLLSPNYLTTSPSMPFNFINTHSVSGQSKKYFSEIMDWVLTHCSCFHH